MRSSLGSIALLLAAGLLLVSGPARSEAEEPPAAAVAPAPAQLFDSKEAAVAALRVALEANDDAALKVMIGAQFEDLVQTGKDPNVARERKRAARKIAEKVAFEAREDGSQTVVVGADAFPAAIPLTLKDGKWFFDGAKGREEMLARRIGRNELAVMDSLRMLVEAQEAYRAKDRDGDGVIEYAQRFVSSVGAKDGLFWIDPEGTSLEDRSPLGALVEDLAPAVGGKLKGTPYQGYFFKMLVRQGACAPCGAQTWMRGQDLVGGFAVLAVPAEHRLTGVKSFIISHRGRLFERDLGPNGVELAKSIEVFNPDTTWIRVGNP